MNNRDQIWGVAKWVGVLLIVFLIAVSIKQFKEIGYIGKNVPVMNSITVVGTGEAISIPDIATFSFGVTENAKTVKEAQDKATERINAALATIKAGGVAENDIKTISYNINPHYEWNQGICTPYGGCPNGKNMLTGYDVSQTIEVKVRDISKAGELFDSIGSTGVKDVNGLQFSIDDIDTIKAEARAEAIANAKEKAQKIAKDLDVRLVRIMSFYDSSDELYPPIYYGREAAMGMGGDMVANQSKVVPGVPAGEQKINARVNITYEIR
jgi:uncharacterized protein